MENNKVIQKIYEEHVESVYRYALFKTSSKEDAEDITSEVFSRYIENLSKTEIEYPKAWLITVCRNMIYDKYNLRSKLEINQDKIDKHIEFDIDTLEKQVLDQEAIEQVKSELANLSDAEQEIIELRLFEDMDFDEISRIIDKKTSAIKLSFYRAIEKLKIALGEREKGKKLYSFNVPIIISALYGLAALPEYKPSTEFLWMLKSNLNISLLKMNAELTSAAAGVSKTTGFGIFSSKIALAAVTSVTAILAVGGAVYLSQANQPDPTPTPTPTPIVTPTPSEGPDQPTEVSLTKKCQVQSTGFSLRIPEDWSCRKEGTGDLTILVIKSGEVLGDVFSIETAILGRGSTYCDGPTDIESEPGQLCEFDRNYYSNKYGKLTLITLNGKQVELIGGFDNGDMHVGMDILINISANDMTAEQKQILFAILDSMKMTVDTAALLKECVMQDIGVTFYFPTDWNCDVRNDGSTSRIGFSSNTVFDGGANAIGMGFGPRNCDGPGWMEVCEVIEDYYTGQYGSLKLLRYKGKDDEIIGSLTDGNRGVLISIQINNLSESSISAAQKRLILKILDRIEI